MFARLAIRSIFRNRRRSMITLAVIVFGAIGLILFGGYKAVTFRGLRESTIRGRVGHLQVYRLGYAAAKSQTPLQYGLDDVTSIRRAIERDARVQFTAAQTTLMGLVGHEEKSETFIATAVEPQMDRLMRNQRIVAGTDLPNGQTDAVLLGKGLAESLGAEPGDYVTLMTTTTTGSLNAIDAHVAGIVISGVKEYDDRSIKMSLPAAQELLQSRKVEKLLVFLHDTEDTASVESDLKALFASRKWALETQNWSQLATFYHQVVMLYNGIFGFLGLIVFSVVVFSVANTIAMSTFERTREIGTLMAVGTTRRQVWRMFFAEGVVLGLIGGILGLAIGALLAFVINHGNVMLPPPPGYTVGYRLQILLQTSVMVTAFVIALVTATLSSIVPAFKASRMKIVDALGHI